MSTSLTRRSLPIILALTTLAACSTQTRPRPESDSPARVHTSVDRSIVGEAPILVDVPIGQGWEVLEDPTIRVDVPIGAAWDGS